MNAEPDNNLLHTRVYQMTGKLISMSRVHDGIKHLLRTRVYHMSANYNEIILNHSIQHW